MELGSKEHKAQMCEDLIKTYHENIWKEEIGILEFEDLLGSPRKDEAAPELKLEPGEYKSAGEGRKEIAKIEADFESNEAAIKKKKSDKEFWQKRIELIPQYSKHN